MHNAQPPARVGTKGLRLGLRGQVCGATALLSHDHDPSDPPSRHCMNPCPNLHHIAAEGSQEPARLSLAYKTHPATTAYHRHFINLDRSAAVPAVPAVHNAADVRAWAATPTLLRLAWDRCPNALLSL